MDNIKIATLQLDLIWEDKIKNLEKIESIIMSISDKVDLIILPEMFTTGFTMNPEKYAESMNGETVGWMKKMAQKKSTSILGSIVIRENSNFYNRAIFVLSNSEISFYNKRHLFRFEGEKDYYKAGETNTIFQINKWRIRPQICYDLRFPIWSRNNNEYDVLINMANWPAKRNEHWVKLLYARAIENQCYVIGCNRIGIDGNGIEYIGNSMVIDPKGNKMNKEMINCESTIIIELSMKDLEQYRNQFPVYLDNDKFKIIK